MDVKGGPSNDTIPPLAQDMPKRFAEIISFLKHSSHPERAKITSYLLDMDGKVRYILNQRINKQIKDASSNKSYSSSIYSQDIRITLFCWTADFPKIKTDNDVLKHIRAVMFFRKESNRVILEITYDENNNLKYFVWHFISLDNLSSIEIKNLSHQADLLRFERLKRIKYKIRRNKPCPCFSGIKYKKCCGKAI
jgi:hypothetical protein